MSLADSHCHLHMLDLTPYQGELSTLIAEAKKNDVEKILCVSVDLTDVETIIKIAEQYPQVYASAGLHPSEKIDKEPTVGELVKLASHKKMIAIGETGLDYYYNTEGLENMRERFRTHIRAAKQLKKPLIIHSRNAQEDTINIMREENAAEISGVMHCFTESLEMAKQALELGFYISFSGIITFKNAADLCAVVAEVPLERILIETDAPFLAPIPFRGKKNEPKYIRYIAEKVAEIKQISYEKVAEQTMQNFKNLFLG